MNVTTPEQFYTKKDYEFLKNNFLQNYHHFFVLLHNTQESNMKMLPILALKWLHEISLKRIWLAIFEKMVSVLHEQINSS